MEQRRGAPRATAVGGSVDAIKMGLRVGWLPPPATAMCPAYLDSKFLMCTVTGSFRKCDDKEKNFFNLKKEV
jgi:hypothetical protein